MFLNVTVSMVPERNRYEIWVDGELAGFTQYVTPSGRTAAPGEIAFVHTKIDGSFSGQGLGVALIRYALDDARRKGLAVIPYCPLMREFIASTRTTSTWYPRIVAPSSSSEENYREGPRLTVLWPA